MNRRAKCDSAIALSSAEKSVTVQIHKQTLTAISKPCLSACADEKWIDQCYNEAT